jgi:hypothetical protein
MVLETRWLQLLYVHLSIHAQRRSLDTVSPATKMAYPEVWRIYKSDEEINWVAFGPHGYYIIDTESRIYASRSDTILRNYKDGKQVPLRCGSFGYGGAWVVVEDDGVIRSSGLSQDVLKMIKVGNVRVGQLPCVFLCRTIH